MKLKTFNFGASFVALVLGALYTFSDGASINANVIGASGADAGLTSIMGLVMIVGSIGLFIVSMNATDHHDFDLERLVRKTKHHEELNTNTETYDDIIVEQK